MTTHKPMTATAALAHTTSPELLAATEFRAMVRALLVEHGGRGADDAAFITALDEKGWDITRKTDAMMLKAAE
jgi:hypothetical protein